MDGTFAVSSQSDSFVWLVLNVLFYLAAVALQEKMRLWLSPILFLLFPYLCFHLLLGFQN